jgi:HSP20 family molecular chaperone IbpA
MVSQTDFQSATKAEMTANNQNKKSRRHRNKKNRKNRNEKKNVEQKKEEEPMDIKSTKEEVKELPQVKVLMDIRDQVNKVEDMVRLRLPRVHEKVLARMYAWIWMMKTIRKDTDQRNALKDVIITLGTHQYDAATQAEILTRLLLELDNVESNGNEGIRKQRKDQVVRIQSLIDEADKENTTAMKLKTHGIGIIQPMIDSLKEKYDRAQPETTSDDMSDASSSDGSSTDEPEEEGENLSDDMETDPKSGAILDAEAETALEQLAKMDKEQQIKKTQKSSENQSSTKKQSPVQRREATAEKLPIWEPETKVTQTDSAFNLLVAIPGVDEDEVSVTFERDGLLTIKGRKQPSRRDVYEYQQFGAQNFGRFNVQRRFDPSEINVDKATLEFQRNGVLVVRVPFAARQIRRMPQTIRRGPTGGYRSPRQAQYGGYGGYHPMSGSYPPRTQSHDPFGFF